MANGGIKAAIVHVTAEEFNNTLWLLREYSVVSEKDGILCGCSENHNSRTSPWLLREPDLAQCAKWPSDAALPMFALQSQLNPDTQFLSISRV